MSAWYKGSGADLTVKFFDAQNHQLNLKFFLLPDVTAWTHVSRTFVAPPGAATLWVFLQSYHSATPVYFDEVGVE